ncbi:MAG: carbon storage regulator [Planctomycetota bacterium]
MLILSRKVEQEIMIGDDVRLTIVRIDSNRVRIGIEAPDQVRILRGELAAKEANAEFELSDRELAFAHPGTATSANEPRLFEGTLQPSRQHVTLREQPTEAPLSAYVSAS